MNIEEYFSFMNFRALILLSFLFIIQSLRAQDCSSCRQWLQKEDSCAAWIVNDLSTQTYLDRYIRCLYDCGDPAAREKAIRLVNYKAVSFSQDGKLGWGIDKFQKRICVIDTAARLIRILDEDWDWPGVFTENIAVLHGSKRQGLLYSNGKLVDNLPYARISSYSEGLAAVGNIRKSGYINREGKLVIPDRYMSAYPFRNGVAVAESASGSGLINKKGEWVLKPVYSGLFQDRNGALLHVKNGGYRMINEKGRSIGDTTWNTIMPGWYSNYKVLKGQQWGLVSPAGETLLEPIWQAVEQVSDSVCWVMKEGKWYIRPLYGDTSMGKIGYESIVFNNLSRYQLVHHKGKYGIIDVLSGELTVPLDYSYIETCTGQSMLQAKKEGMTGFINLKNEPVIPFEFSEVYERDALTVQMRHKNKFTVYGTDGHKIFSWDSYCGEFCNGVARFFEGFPYKYGYFNLDGKVIVPPVYDDVQNYHTGLAWVRKNGLFGYVDLTGKLVIPMIYSAASEFSEGQATVLLNGDKVVINTQGKVIRKAGSVPYNQDQKSAEGPEPPLRIKGN